MIKVLIVTLGATALSTGAFATEAFIGQVGDHQTAQNIQLNQSNLSKSQAIIYQRENAGGSNGHDALQVQLGDNDYAYTFQDSLYFDHVALTWQDGHDNSAVTVQMTGSTTENSGNCNENLTSGCTSPAYDARYKSHIIQNGNYNVAVNWQSDTGGHPIYSLTPTTPTLTLTNGSSPVNGNGVYANPDLGFVTFQSHFN